MHHGSAANSENGPEAAALTSVPSGTDVGMRRAGAGPGSFAFERLHAAAVVLDHRGVIVDTNEAWRLFAGLNGGTAPTTGVGVSYLGVCDRAAAAGDPDAAHVAAGLRQILDGDREHIDHEYRASSSTEDRWFLLQASAAPVEHGSGVVLFHVDVTARKLLETRLAGEADHDELTGVANRRAALSRLERLLGAPGLVTVLSIDLEGLREVSDELGHHAGDELLVKAATRVRRAVRETDLVARLGGGRFLVVCSGVDGRRAEQLAARVRAVMSEAFQVGARKVQLGASVGVATSEEERSVDALLRRAATAMERDEGARDGATRPVTGDAGAATATGPACLRSNPALLDAVLSHIDELVMFVFDSEARILWSSRAGAELVEADPSELVGRDGFEFVHPDDQARLAEEFADSEPGSRVEVEFRTLGLHGGARWTQEVISSSFSYTATGLHVGSLRDVSDRREAEASVRHQAQLLGAVGQAVVAHDRDTVVTHWNAAAERLYGIPAADAVGRPIADLLLEGEGAGGAGAELWRELLAGRPWSGDLVVRRPDGRSVPVMVSAFPVEDAQGELTGSVTVSWDLSERRDAERNAALLAAIVDSSEDAIFSVTPEGVVTSWNEAAARLFERPASEIVGRHSSELVAEEHVGWVENMLDRLRAGAAARVVEMNRVRSDGTTVHLTASFSPVRDRSGLVVGASVIARDVTERVTLHRELAEDRRRLADAQAAARLGSFEIDLGTGEVTASVELLRIFGEVEENSRAVTFDHVHPEDREAMRRAFDAATASDGETEFTCRIQRADGEVRWIRARSSVVDDGGPRRLVGAMLDITEQREAELALVHRATHDELTGLPNRVGLTDGLREMLLAAGRDRQALAVVLLDLDQFKVINDTLGHTIGDRTLQALAERLRTRLDDGDLLARFGGDEFVVARAGVADLEEACRLAEEIGGILREPLAVAGRRFDLTASVGVTLSAGLDSPESLLRDADAAVYQAKEDGRARTAVFDARARGRAQRRLSVETALRGALEAGELRLEYQPVLTLADLRPAGFEALLRWESAELGPVPPEEFIPVAEGSGLIIPVGEWVLDEAVAQLQRWRADGAVPRSLWMAVNLAAPQLGHDGIVDRVLRRLDDARMEAGLLHLEVTESVLLDHVEHAASNLTRLRDAGVRVSIDDFGTGYSSLSYLSRLPVDALKIDRSFVRDALSDGYDASIIRAILALAAPLGLDTVAEGVEEPGQLQLLRALGCTHGQGFLWSRALPAAEALDWLCRHLAR